MADKNIQIKKNNGTGWDNIYPVTRGGNVVANDGTTTFESHLGDNVKHIPYATTTNSGNAYSVTVSNLTALTDGYPLCVKFNVASTGAVTINPNSLGAKNVVDYFGNAVTNVRANLIANLRYESTSGNFILQGKGGGGNATAAQLLSGQTATVDSGQIIGTMPIKSGITYTPTTSDQTISIGYEDGTCKVKGDANLIPSNIEIGKTIFGVSGTANLSCTAGYYVIASHSSYIGVSGGTYAQSTTPSKRFEVTINKTGIIRFIFDIYTTSTAVTAYGRVYKNGVAFGTLRSTTAGPTCSSAVRFSEDLSVTAGDTLQLYMWNNNGGYWIYALNILVCTTESFSAWSSMSYPLS